MSAVKKIGIWVDNSIANLMEYTTGMIKTITVESDVLKLGLDYNTSYGNPAFAQIYEQKLQSEIYHKLSKMLENCKEVILFGPTYTKVKLYNKLVTDFGFKGTRIAVVKTDKMTKKEQEAFLEERFSKSNL